jgi:hypothetical protein
MVAARHLECDGLAGRLPDPAQDRVGQRVQVQRRLPDVRESGHGRAEAEALRLADGDEEAMLFQRIKQAVERRPRQVDAFQELAGGQLGRLLGEGKEDLEGAADGTDVLVLLSGGHGVLLSRDRRLCPPNGHVDRSLA